MTFYSGFGNDIDILINAKIQELLSNLNDGCYDGANWYYDDLELTMEGLRFDMNARNFCVINGYESEGEEEMCPSCKEKLEKFENEILPDITTYIVKNLDLSQSNMELMKDYIFYLMQNKFF